MEKEFSHEFIKHAFSEDEKKDIATEMALKVSELTGLEDQKKAITSDFKSQIDGLTAKINGAATKINNGYEMQSVKCEVVKDAAAKTVFFYRVDTGELAKERAMRPDEYQMKIDEVA